MLKFKIYILLVCCCCGSILYAQDQEREDNRLYITAVQEKLSGNYESAAIKFESFITRHPKSADAMYNLAAIYDAQGRVTKALTYSDQACKIEAKNKWYLLQRAYLLQRNKDFKSSIKVYDQLLKLEPKNAEFIFSKADAQLQANDLKGAIKTLDNAQKILGASPEIVYEKYRIYTLAEKYTEALKELEVLLSLNPTDTRVMGMMGEIHDHLGNKEKALEYYQMILKTDPNNGIVHLSIAQYYYSKGEDKKALEELKLAMGSTQVDVDTKMRIMLDYFERSERNEAVKKESYELLELMQQAQPNEAKVYSIYGDFLYRDNKLRESREKYRKAVELDKSRFPLWNQLILVDAQLNDKVLLYEDSKEAKELFPTQAGFYFYHGLASNQMKKYQEAIDALTTAESLVIDNDQLSGDIYQGLGEAYNYLKNYPESDKYYDKALKLDPSNVFALNNYAYYLSLRKENLEKAATMAKKANEIRPDNPSFEDTYGWILFIQGKYSEAEAWIKRALQHGGDKNGTLLEHYGDVASKLNRTADAITYWKLALETGEHSTNIEKKISTGKYVE